MPLLSALSWNHKMNKRAPTLAYGRVKPVHTVQNITHRRGWLFVDKDNTILVNGFLMS
jgi:hypothetical protein